MIKEVTILKELKNFNAVITGATGSLGREVTMEFLRNGGNVITNYRNENKFLDLKKYVFDSKKLYGYQADLTLENNVKSFFAEVEDRFKRIDALIHLMGGFWMGKEIADTDLNNWKHMMSLNLTSTFLCTREVFSKMRKQCGGTIITISSKTANEFPDRMGAYSVSKAAVLGLTQTLANEGKPYNIQANCLLPSIIDTPANRNSMPDADYTKWVNPNDIAKLLIQLCKPQARLLSQTALKIYGKL